MDEDDDRLLEKADALMHRHRTFVAGEGGRDELAAAEGDVPILTEIVESPTAPLAPVESVVDLAELRSALAGELEAWLDAELPRHVMHVLDGVTDRLIIELSLKAKSDLLPRLQAAAEAAMQAAKPAPADE